MDRRKKEEWVQRQDGKVFDAGNVTIDEERYRSPDYKFEVEDCHLSSTGHLKIFRLMPISGKPLSFTAEAEKQASRNDSNSTSTWKACRMTKLGNSKGISADTQDTIAYLLLQTGIAIRFY
jgi:hypothetical protein